MGIFLNNVELASFSHTFFDSSSYVGVWGLYPYPGLITVGLYRVKSNRFCVPWHDSKLQLVMRLRSSSAAGEGN